MPYIEQLSEESLISQAQQLRLNTLHGNPGTIDLARECEKELHKRLLRPIDAMSIQSTNYASSIAPNSTERLNGRSEGSGMITAAASQRVATAGDAENSTKEAIKKLLSSLRELLDMDIALVAEFKDGNRIFRHVDVDPTQPAKLQVGESVPLEGTYCQRVNDGRLPSIIPDTAAVPETLDLAATQSLAIGAYLSVPVVLANGQVYGTLCCISHKARSALGCRQADALRSAAKLVSAEIQKKR